MNSPSSSSFERKMSKSFSFTIGSDEINLNTTVVIDESELEEELKFLFPINHERYYGKKFRCLVGLGTEKSFSSTMDGLISEKVAVLKLCKNNYCLIVHLIHFKKIPVCLARFLDVSDITVVGIGIKQSLCDLRRDYGIECRNTVVDLADFAAEVKMDPTLRSYCLVDLCRYLFPIFRRKGWWYTCLVKSSDIAFGDWGTSVLSEEQICHASKEIYATVFAAKSTID
jgi:hypothetical protein